MAQREYQTCRAETLLPLAFPAVDPNDKATPLRFRSLRIGLQAVNMTSLGRPALTSLTPLSPCTAASF
jgi:hypothetical protein